MRYALLDADGVVVDLIEADVDFADALAAQVDDDSIDTPAHLDAVRRAVALGDDTPSDVTVGWRLARKKWSAAPAS